MMFWFETANARVTDVEFVPQLTIWKFRRVQTQAFSGKPWKYLLMPHDAITENVTLAWLAQRFEEK